MGRIATLVLGICAAMALGTSAAQAGAWQFVETSCQPAPGFFAPLACSEVGILPPTPIMLPKVVATFSSPDLTGSYQFKDNGSISGPPSMVGESGDTNFTFHWADTDQPLVAPGTVGCDCAFVINWSGAPTFVYAFQFTDGTTVNISDHGQIGSGLFIAGCGGNGEQIGPACDIGGHWDPVGVPEASSVKLLGGALALLTLLPLARMRPRARSGPSRG